MSYFRFVGPPIPPPPVVDPEFTLRGVTFKHQGPAVLVEDEVTIRKLRARNDFAEVAKPEKGHSDGSDDKRGTQEHDPDSLGSGAKRGFHKRSRRGDSGQGG